MAWRGSEPNDRAFLGARLRRMTAVEAQSMHVFAFSAHIRPQFR
jgi:hypothetical protein